MIRGNEDKHFTLAELIKAPRVSRMKRMIRKLATSLTFIVVVAIAARMTFAWDQAHKIPPDVLAIVPFQQETGNIAYSLAQGQGFGGVSRTETGRTAWLAPIYPLMIAGIFKIFGVFTTRAFFAVVFLNIIFSSAACAPVFFVAKRIAGLGTAAFAAWLWALFPNAIMVPFEWIWDTSLSALLAATILWATLVLAESDRVQDWCAYGLLWGFALMTNPALGALLPFLLGWLACGDKHAYRGLSGSRLRWKRVALAAGVAILCCVPWTVRNYAAFHRFIPLRSNLPFELWLGNNENFDPQSQIVPPPDPERAEIRNYIHMGQTAFMQN